MIDIREAVELAREIRSLKGHVMPGLVDALERKLMYDVAVSLPPEDKTPTVMIDLHGDGEGLSTKLLGALKGRESDSTLRSPKRTSSRSSRLESAHRKDERWPQAELNYIIPFTADENSLLGQFNSGHYTWSVVNFRAPASAFIHDMYGVSTSHTIRTGGDAGKKQPDAYAVFRFAGIEFSELAFLHVKHNSSYDSIAKAQRRSLLLAKNPYQLYVSVLTRLWLVVRAGIREKAGKKNWQLSITDDMALAGLWDMFSNESVRYFGFAPSRVGYISAKREDLTSYKPWLGAFLSPSMFNVTRGRKQTPSEEAKERALAEAEAQQDDVDRGMTLGPAHVHGDVSIPEADDEPDDAVHDNFSERAANEGARIAAEAREEREAE
jgi:hypothetical protein